MPLRRAYDPARGKVVTTIGDIYADRLARWSDIREYMPYLREQARGTVIELGTRKGNSTVAFLAGGARVWSADIADVTAGPDGMGRWRGIPGWTFIRGDDMDPAVQARLPAKCDVLFVDTSHEYEHTLADLRAYMPRVVPGGVALFHDTNLAGWGGNPPVAGVPEVAQALDAWCAEAGMSWENLPGVYGLGVIRVDSQPAAA